MPDQQKQSNDEAHAAQEITEDLEPTDETAVSIRGGDRPVTNPELGDLRITKPADLSSPSPLL